MIPLSEVQKVFILLIHVIRRIYEHAIKRTSWVVSRHYSKATKVSCTSSKAFNSSRTKCNTKTDSRCSDSRKTNSKTHLLPVSNTRDNAFAKVSTSHKGSFTNSTPEIKMLFLTPRVVSGKLFLRNVFRRDSNTLSLKVCHLHGDFFTT